MKYEEKQFLLIVNEFQKVSEAFNKFASKLDLLASEVFNNDQASDFAVKDYLVVPESMRKKRRR